MDSVYHFSMGKWFIFFNIYRSNHYEILNAELNATQAELKKLYLVAIRENHPDKNQQNQELANELSQRINAAFQTLCDPVKKAVYDKKIGNRQGTGSIVINKMRIFRIPLSLTIKNNCIKSAKLFGFF